MKQNRFITIRSDLGEVHIRADKITALYDSEKGVYIYVFGWESPFLAYRRDGEMTAAEMLEYLNWSAE